MTAGTSGRYIGQEKRSSQSKIHRTTRETIDPIHDISDDETSDCKSKLAWAEEANKVEDKEAADSAAVEVVGEETATEVIYII